MSKDSQTLAQAHISQFQENASQNIELSTLGRIRERLQSLLPTPTNAIHLASGIGKLTAGIGSIMAGYEVYTDNDITDSTNKALGTVGHSSEGVLMIASGVSELVSMIPSNKLTQKNINKISSFLQAFASVGTSIASAGAFRDGDNVSGSLHATQAASNVGTALANLVESIKKNKTCKYSLSTISNIVDTAASLAVGIYANATGHLVESAGNFTQTLSSAGEVSHHQYKKKARKKLKDIEGNTTQSKPEDSLLEQYQEQQYIATVATSNRFEVLSELQKEEDHMLLQQLSNQVEKPKAHKLSSKKRSYEI